MGPVDTGAQGPQQVSPQLRASSPGSAEERASGGVCHRGAPIAFLHAAALVDTDGYHGVGFRHLA